MNPSKSINTTQFLELIHGPDSPIYFQVGGKTWTRKPQSFHQAENKLAWRNREGDGICFVVNGGGCKDANISRFNACFIDWDAGRDTDGRYLNDQSVAQAKAAFKEVLRDFTLAPSIIVETRNGFHVYWLLQGDVDAGAFRLCQRRLADHLSGDPVAVNPARLMRLPGFDWTKAGYDRFAVQVISHQDKRYAIGDVLAALPSSSEPEMAIRHHNKCGSVSTTALIVVSKPAQSSLVLSTMEEAIEYFKKQDLRRYLRLTSDGTAQTVKCPFHGDTTASASIGQDIASGHWLFCCHSSNCGVQGSIIDVTMRMMGSPRVADALRHLMAHYGIVISTGWKAREEAILNGNIAVLTNPRAIKAMYPSLYRWIGRIAQDLITKLRWARTLLLDERMQVNGRAVFFMSLREMERRAKGETEQPHHFGKQSQRVDRYCLLGLMRKVPDCELPADILKAARAKQGRHPHRIQFYSVPEYTSELLHLAERRATTLIGAGALTCGVSRQLAKDLLGDLIGEEIYPQRANKSSSAMDDFEAQISSIVMTQVAEKGFATTAGILEQFRGAYGSVTHRRIERVLPGILHRNRLKKITASTALKVMLCIEARGWPKVVVPQTEP